MKKLLLIFSVCYLMLGNFTGGLYAQCPVDLQDEFVGVPSSSPQNFSFNYCCEKQFFVRLTNNSTNVAVLELSGGTTTGLGDYSSGTITLFPGQSSMHLIYLNYYEEWMGELDMYYYEWQFTVNVQTVGTTPEIKYEVLLCD